MVYPPPYAGARNSIATTVTAIFERHVDSWILIYATILKVLLSHNGPQGQRAANPHLLALERECWHPRNVMIISTHWLVRHLARCLLACTPAMIIFAGETVQAQAPSAPSAQIFYSPIGPLTDTITRYQSDPRPKSADGAFQLSDWLLFGGMGWGAACGYNVNSSPTNQVQACGPQFTPSIVAEHNTGIQRTLLYGVGDIRYYPSLSRVDVVDTTSGLVHVWEIQRDLIFRVQVQGLLNQGYSAFAANLASTNAFLTTPLKYSQGYASTSLQKEFGSFFTAIGGSFTRTDYQDISDNFGHVIDEHFQDGNVSTLNARLGYNLSPITYTYLEPSWNWQQYADPRLNSQGYRVVAGLGTERISLFSGEAYAGFATQQFDNDAVGTVSVPNFGGRLAWYPTRFLTFTFTADRMFGTSDLAATVPIIPGSILNTGSGLIPGSVTNTTTANLAGVWDFSRTFSFTANVSEANLDYLDTFRRDDLVTLGGGVIFKIRPGLGLAINYAHQHLFSNAAGAAFSTDLISGGVQSKF